jgi:peptidoglycan hydrolase-like protein with peptidoglycan-binding domain
MQLLPRRMQELLRVRATLSVLPALSPHNQAREIGAVRAVSYGMRVITVVLLFTVLGGLGLGLVPSASAATSDEIKTVQKSLNDKGYDAGPVDGVLGSRTRAGIRQYQASEKLTVTGRLDVETAGKLGVGPESIGGSFKGAGQDVGAGGQELGHEIKQGKPIAGGKEFGIGVSRAAKKVATGVEKAVTTDSDRAEREKR